jgi:hypothetical protein
MTISEITTNQALFDHSGAMEKTEHLPKGSPAPRDHSVSHPRNEAEMKEGRAPLAFSSLDSAKSRLNEVAKGIRHAHREVETIERYVDRMTAELETMVKNFPPFPPGSEERVKRLRTLNSYRKIIVQLTFPQNGQMAEGAATRGPTQGFYGSDQELDIPLLPDEATDEQLRASLEDMGKAKKELEQRGERLSKDVAASIGHFQEDKAELMGLYSGSREDHDPAYDRQATAEIESERVKHQLTMEPGMALTEAQSQLLSLLN